MKHSKYFLQFLLVIVILLIFRLLGPNVSSKVGGKLFEKVGHFFKSKKIIHSNIKKFFPKLTQVI